MSQYDFKINPEDDPVEMAVRIFNGTRSSRALWREYLHTFCEEFNDIDKAYSFFFECIYRAKCELGFDKFKDTYGDSDHIHAKQFTLYLKRFLKKKGKNEQPQTRPDRPHARPNLPQDDAAGARQKPQV